MNPIIRIYFEALCDLRHENFNTLKIATCYIICRLTLAPHRISSHSCSAVSVHGACTHMCVCVWERLCCPGERKRNNKIKLVIFVSKKKMMTEIGHIQIHYPIRGASPGRPLHSASIRIQLTAHIHMHPSIRVTNSNSKEQKSELTQRIHLRSCHVTFPRCLCLNFDFCCFTFRSNRNRIEKNRLWVIYMRV